jgi:dCMP deaminase
MTAQYDQHTLTTWDLRFLALAEHIAEWSKDPSTKVGAVVSRGRLMVSMGFNGFPARVSDLPERYADRDTKLRMTVHAEANAILHAHQPIHGCTLYVSAPPCASCAALIVQSGIFRIVYREPAPEFAERWRADMTAAFTMFTEADVIRCPVGGMELAGVSARQPSQMALVSTGRAFRPIVPRLVMGDSGPIVCGEHEDCA